MPTSNLPERIAPLDARVCRLLDLKADAWMKLAECRDDLWKEGSAVGVDYADRHHAAGAALEFGNRDAGRLGVGQQPAGVVAQQAPWFGQLHAAPGTVEQHACQIALERADLLR